VDIANGKVGVDDYLAAGHSIDDLLALATDELRKFGPTTAVPSIRAVGFREFLATEIPPRKVILDPILREQSTGMLHAWRGVGKTQVAIGIAYAIATGGKFLRWEAPEPRRVLYVDGELPGATLQERLADAARLAGGEPPDDSYLQIITPDKQDFPLPNFATEQGQELLNPLIERADVLILDSLSTLCPRPRQNETDSWLSIQGWLLELRRKGKAVLVLEHDGKGGQQRGTSAKEDILDLSLHIVRPSDYTPDQNARFEVHFVKTRGLLGEATLPFEAWLKPEGWEMRKIEDVVLGRAVELFHEGCSVRDVAEELKISKTHAGRLRKKCEAGGLLKS
jgi:putative DNA primase/helicase